MTRNEFPTGMLTLTRVPHWLLARGVPLGPLRLLETIGRRSRQPRTTPVVVLRARGVEWIVSPFGETDWVRNYRAGGDVRLGRARGLRKVTLTDAPPDLVPALLRAYRRRYRLVPFVRAAFAPGGSDGVEAFAAVAQYHPVFRVDT